MSWNRRNGRYILCSTDTFFSLWSKLVDGIKVKSYFSKCHITSSACNVVRERRGIASLNPNLGTKWRWVVILTPRLICLVRSASVSRSVVGYGVLTHRLM